MTIEQFQKEVDQWIKEYGVDYFDELTNTIILMEEVGEFSSLVARLYGQQSFKNKGLEMDAGMKLQDELSDIMFVLVCLANQMDIDLTLALRSNLEKKTERDAERHKNNPKLGKDSS